MCIRDRRRGAMPPRSSEQRRTTEWWLPSVRLRSRRQQDRTSIVVMDHEMPYTCGQRLDDLIRGAHVAPPRQFTAGERVEEPIERAVAHLAHPLSALSALSAHSLATVTAIGR